MNESFGTIQKICPQCGEAVDTDAKFCKYCAFNLAHSNAGQNFSPEINQTPTNNNTLIISGIIGLLVVGLVGLVIFLNAGKNNQSVVENANSASQSSASTLTLGEKAQQIEQKILRGDALSESDIEGLSATELRILRNVHFARYGRKYERPGLGDYFSTRPWYKPRDDYNESMIASHDKANVNLILAAENIAKNGEIVSANSNTVMNTSVVDNSNSLTVTTPQSTNDLNRQTVLSLVSGIIPERTVTVSMTNSSYQSSGRTAAYSRMIEDKIISCEWDNSVGWWKKCELGPKGTSLRKEEGYFQLTIGKISPTDVSGISRISDSSAFADVVLSFEGNNNYEFYSRHSNAFYDNGDTRNQTQRIMLRLYDDGWRIESNR